jgi:hypothetical protein
MLSAANPAISFESQIAPRADAALSATAHDDHRIAFLARPDQRLPTVSLLPTPRLAQRRGFRVAPRTMSSKLSAATCSTFHSRIATTELLRLSIPARPHRGTRDARAAVPLHQWSGGVDRALRAQLFIPACRLHPPAFRRAWLQRCRFLPSTFRRHSQMLSIEIRNWRSCPSGSAERPLCGGDSRTPRKTAFGR